MNLGLALSVFAVIFVAELPDKTMIATLVMGSRATPSAVWSGASLAFLLHMALAAVAGGLLSLLPHTVLEVVVTVLFLAGAAYLLLVPEREEIEEGAEAAEREHRASWPKMAATAFGVIFVGEFGDLTQILAANFVAKSHQPLLVFVAASAALLSVSALGAFGGQLLLRFLPLQRIRKIGGLLLLALGIVSVVQLLSA